MLGYETTTVLIVLGVVVVCIALLGGVRGLYTPGVPPVFYRKRKKKSDENPPVPTPQYRRRRKAEKNEV